MNRFSAEKVTLSEMAYSTIHDSVTKANNQFEVGGVLLGYRAFNCFYIVAVTAQTDMSEKSKVEFTLDSEWHMAQIEEISRTIRPELSILGIWHSHICDGDRFSDQDRRSNKQLAEAYDGVVSILATMPSQPGIVNVTVYYVPPSGAEHHCKTKRVGFVSGEEYCDRSGDPDIWA